MAKQQVYTAVGLFGVLSCGTGVLAAPTIPFEQADPTADEQYLLELVNRARANPAAETARLGIDLNAGLAAGTISVESKPPLALHTQLIDAARAHSQWMLNTDTFSHTGVNNSTPGERMSAAGYVFSGSWTWGENIAWQGSTGDLGDVAIVTAVLHDSWIKSAGHRENLMNPDFDEIGIGLLTGQFEQYNALMGTQTFARSDNSPGPLLLGVVYDDVNKNGNYEPGEGVGGVMVQPTGSDYYAVTASAGGYAVPYSEIGNMTVTFSGAALAGAVITRSIETHGDNIKLDLVLTPTAERFALLLNKTGTGNGIITSADGAINCGTNCSAELNSGGKITLTASADANSVFVGWSGACTNKTGNCVVTMSKAQTVTATFNAAPKYSLSVSVVGSGSVKSNPVGINCGTDCNEQYASGKAITLTATAKTGMSFIGWAGACSGNKTACTVKMTKAQAVAAVFQPTQYLLTAVAVGGGIVTSNPIGINCGTDCKEEYAAGKSIILTAKPDSGKKLFGWAGACSGNKTTCTVKMNQAQVAAAIFQ